MLVFYLKSKTIFGIFKARPNILRHFRMGQPTQLPFTLDSLHRICLQLPKILASATENPGSSGVVRVSPNSKYATGRSAFSKKR